MRILHAADTHVGFAAYNRLTPDGLNQREQDVFLAFRQIVDVAIRERVDALVHAGDLFDSVRPTNRAVTFVMEELRRLADAGIPFVAIAGNHETPRLRETGSVFRFLDFVPGTLTAYKGRYEVKRVADAAFHLVPHVQSQDAFVAELEKAAPDPAARFNVLVLHGGVVGIDAFSGEELNAITIPHRVLDGPWDHVALGHYHRATRLTDRAWYCGSAERLTFGEAKDRKGVLLVDLAAKEVREIPLDTRPMVEVPTLDCSGLAEVEVAYEVLRRIRDAPIDDALARFRVRNLPSAAYQRLDHDALRKSGSRAVHFSFEPEIVREGAVRQAAEALASLDAELDAFLAEAAVGEDGDEVRDLAREFLAQALEASRGSDDDGVRA